MNNEIMNNQIIKFFSLGGLGEVGKNMYVCEVDERIFIFDAGSKMPGDDLLGVDNVYPNISYLEDNASRIVGLFLTHAHDENIGATIEILKRFNVGIFASHFTISILEDKIKEAGLEIKNYRLYRINEEKILKFGDSQVEAYFVSHSIPETLNYAICTRSGIIVYAPEFTFNISNDRKYTINFDKISDLGKRGVLALACGSMGVNNTGTHSNVFLENSVTQFAMKDKRIIISMYSTDLDKLQRVINICLKFNRRIALLGRKTQKLISKAIEIGYIDVPEERLVNLRFRDINNIENDEKDLAIIILGKNHEPYYSVERMCKGNDRLIKIGRNDEVLFIAPPQVGCERIASRAVDSLIMCGAKYHSLGEEELRSEYADREEMKMLYNMLKPKYLIPICGEFRHQYVQKQIATESFFDEKNVIVVENGEVLTFVNGEFKGLTDHITCGDVLVDGAIVGDVNDMVLKDRELMSEDGIIIATIFISKNKKRIIDGPKFEFCGVIKDKNDVFFNELDEVTNNFFKSYFRLKDEEKTMSCNEMLRDCLMKKMFADTVKRPLIIPSVVEIEE